MLQLTTITKRKWTVDQLESLHNRAFKAGEAALKGCQPTPMVVQQHENPLDDNSPVTKSYFVGGGVCGFAWVIIRPANSQFANYLKKNHNAGKSYYGGCQWFPHVGGQFYELKMAFCQAYAEVVHGAGFDAYADGRLD